MATFNAEEWTPGFDEFNRPCWYHKVTRSRVYNQFPPAVPGGLSAMNGTGPNLPTVAQFNPASGVAAEALWKQALAGAWKEYETDGDKGEKKSYWHNAMSGETTWVKPDTNEGKPPPPPAPPAPPAEPKQAAPVKKEREKDQWKQVRNDKGRKYWYNEKTGESQFDTPDCLRKYR